MIEGLSVLCDLLLRESLRVSDEDLVLGLIASPVDGSDELTPAGTEGLHGVLTVRVVKDEDRLHSLKVTSRRENNT